MRNRKVMRTAVLTIGIAMSVVAAPLANAAPSGPTCSATALSTLCQSPGNAQVVARPPVVDYQAQLPYYGGYGFYPFGIGRMHR
ncbi:hypothetical protein [Mycolicibacterium baixiangningiae]|uniref:hypothetical protein n=1 Tax=Mycolicibacterium baixiangningiae TaxID=2761578 RepID=UPI0018D08D0F|nr:hypothetical protein [Mycolicibacterium baixiangningiae]